jgi:peptide/nickel transport system substrate-binding protein
MTKSHVTKLHRGVIAGLVIAATATWATSVEAGNPDSHDSAAGTSAPVPGGHVTVSGDAEVSSPWTPAAMRCDSYCYTRARTFFDQVAVFGDDGQVHGMLAESIEPNDDFTEWTIRIREGISFTDGTPLNAAAVIYNLQAAGTGVLVNAVVKDVAKVPDPADPERTILKIEQLDDLTFVIYTGDDGDPAKPLPWRNFPHTLAGQWGLIASPFWLDEVADNPELATRPVGSGPFVVDSYEPRGSLDVSRNPDYWMTDADGNQLPYLDSISFRVIEDSEIAVEALQSGDVDIVTTSNGRATSTIQALGDEFTVTVQDDYVETFYVLPDLDKQGPLQDRRVRCAMSMAIDRQEYVDATSNGFNTVANGLFSPGQQGYLDDNGLLVEQDLDAAADLISDYEEETGTDVAFTLGHIPSNVVVQGAELLLGWWSEVGIDVETQAVPQNDFINLAAFGTPEFELFLWRQHTGVFVDQQYLWWHSDNAFPDGELSLNFGRLRDSDIDAGLDAARRSTTDEEARAAAEDVNRVFAEQCYYIPLAWLPWAVLSDRRIGGIGGLRLPDGTAVADGSASAGQFWMQTLHVAER